MLAPVVHVAKALAHPSTPLKADPRPLLPVSEYVPPPQHQNHRQQVLRAQAASHPPLPTSAPSPPAPPDPVTPVAPASETSSPPSSRATTSSRTGHRIPSNSTRRKIPPAARGIRAAQYRMRVWRLVRCNIMRVSILMCLVAHGLPMEAETARAVRPRNARTSTWLVRPRMRTSCRRRAGAESGMRVGVKVE